ncbi:MAG: diacylglycerol kinase family protein [Anaerolineae bacterium]|jgi:YegS/Rv2252/BmrU family lipid kinase
MVSREEGLKPFALPRINEGSVFIVVNPRSGDYEARLFRDVIDRILGDGRYAYRVYEMTGREDVAQTVRDAIAEGFDYIVAAGGDGTVASVAAGMVGSDVPLGIIPSGTGNALARELGIPLNADEALNLIVGDHDITSLDVMRANGGIRVLSVSVGLTSAVMQETETEDKRRFGRLAYIWEGVRLAVGYQPHRFDLTVDGQHRHLRASEIIVTNASRVGGSALRWGPRVHPDDGQMMVCTLYAHSLPEYLRIAWSLVRGLFFPSRRRDPRIRCQIARERITIRAESTLTVQADGEVVGQTPVEVELVPGAVRMIVPEAATRAAAGETGAGGGMWIDRARLFIDRQSWLEKLAISVQSWVQGIYRSGRFIGGPVKDALHGVWLRHPLHPVLTDVTVGAWIMTAALDAAGTAHHDERLEIGAQATITTGLVSSALTIAAGITDWVHLSHRARRVGMLHALLNALSLVFYGVSLLLRRRGRRAAGWRVAVGGLLTASVAAFLGSEMTYVLRSGVDHAGGYALPGRFTPIMPLAELPEGELYRTQWNDTPIVLVRRGEQVYALVATCAHLGGPLNEGVLEDDTIVCPWHGSRYRLRDGRVYGGPSVHRQPALEARVLEGQVEVRAMRMGNNHG